MTFTGNNLLLVKYGLELAHSEFHNQWVTCPDPGNRPDEMRELEKNKGVLTRLLRLVEKAITREAQR